MVIRSRGPSREYDAGWDAIFGTKGEHPSDCDVCEGRKPSEHLQELTRLSQEMGLYEDQDKQSTCSGCDTSNCSNDGCIITYNRYDPPPSACPCACHSKT